MCWNVKVNTDDSGSFFECNWSWDRCLMDWNHRWFVSMCDNWFHGCGDLNSGWNTNLMNLKKKIKRTFAYICYLSCWGGKDRGLPNTCWEGDLGFVGPKTLPTGGSLGELCTSAFSSHVKIYYVYIYIYTCLIYPKLIRTCIQKYILKLQSFWRL